VDRSDSNDKHTKNPKRTPRFVEKNSSFFLTSFPSQQCASSPTQEKKNDSKTRNATKKKTFVTFFGMICCSLVVMLAAVGSVGFPPHSHHLSGFLF